MYQFDAYINSVLKDLNISKRQKYEMSDEFNDHLEGLKQEYIDKGLTEDEAVVKAIEDFGNGRELSKRLNYSLLNYRTKSNILFGIGYLFLILLVCMVSFNIAFRPSHYIDIQEPLGFVKYQGIFVVLDIIVISAIDYFLLIIFMKVKKISHLVSINTLIIVCVFSYCIITFQIPLSTIIPHTLRNDMLYICIIAEVLFGSILGRILLNVVNSRTSKFKELASK